MLPSSYSAMDLNEQLVMGTLWFQASSEFRALSYQTFSLAKMMVEKDLMDTTVTMPRAIVVDLILKSLTPSDDGVDQKWKKIALRRVEEIKTRKVKLVPGEEVFKKI